VIAGEDRIKAAGIEYLPKLPEQSEEDYQAYKTRAKFFGATARTSAGLNGLLFRKAPEIKSLAELAKFEPDCDLGGKSLGEYAKDTAKEILDVGRAGTLVDWSDDELRPFLIFYCAEDIVDWEMRRIGGAMTLTRVVLRECVPPPVAVFNPNDPPDREPYERILVCQMNAQGFYEVQIWTKTGATGEELADWMLAEVRVPKRRGKALTFIPFVFHNATTTDECCAPPPLDDIITVNLHHYRVSADYNHALHFSACPTAWVAGFPKESKLAVGSSVAWVSENVAAKAGYLEYSGQGIEPIRQALNDDKSEMAILGARLLEEQKRDTEATETVRLRQTGETSILVNISDNLSKTLTRAWKMAGWWAGTMGEPTDVSDDAASVRINKDFIESQMGSDVLTALVASWLQGAISRTTLNFNLRRGELYPPDLTDDEERQLIEDEMPMLTDMIRAQRSPLPGEPPPPGPGNGNPANQ